MRLRKHARHVWVSITANVKADVYERQLAIEGLPGYPTRTIVRFRLIQFDGAEVGGSTCEVVIDCGQQNTRVDRLSLRIEAEIQVHRVIHVVPARWVWRPQIFKDVIVQFEAVLFLSGCVPELCQAPKDLPVRLLGLVRGLSARGC